MRSRSLGNILRGTIDVVGGCEDTVCAVFVGSAELAKYEIIALTVLASCPSFRTFMITSMLSDSVISTGYGKIIDYRLAPSQSWDVRGNNRRFEC